MELVSERLILKIEYLFTRNFENSRTPPITAFASKKYSSTDSFSKSVNEDYILQKN